MLDLHAKRAAEIRTECERVGHDSYQAKNMAARTTRRAKHHEPEGQLVARWQAELEGAGHSIAGLEKSIETAARKRPHIVPLQASSARLKKVRALVDEALESGGSLATRKVFGRKEVVVAPAPKLFGQDPTPFCPRWSTGPRPTPRSSHSSE